MNQALFTLPILPGKTEAARAFLREMNSSRKQQCAECNQGLGIVKDVWAIQQTPQGDVFVAYLAGGNITEAFQQVATSQSEFDRWFKQQVQQTTGADLNTPPAGPLSEILADYQS